MRTFAEKTIVITGASEGIGRALALSLAVQRPKLVLAARNEERLRSCAEECEGLGAETLVCATDITDEKQCASLVERTAERFGGIDVLVNNAGGTMWTRFDEVEDLSIYEHLTKLNYLSAVWLTSYALPYLKERDGLIVAVSSVAGLTGVPCRTGYAATKHAMFGFFDSLRIELADEGVNVTVVAPDFVVTEIHKRALKGDGTPMVDTPMKEDKIMDARTCAEEIVAAMERRQRLRIMSFRGQAGRWLKLIAPRVIDNMAKKAIEEGH